MFFVVKKIALKGWGGMLHFLCFNFEYFICRGVVLLVVLK